MSFLFCFYYVILEISTVIYMNPNTFCPLLQDFNFYYIPSCRGTGKVINIKKNIYLRARTQNCKRTLCNRNDLLNHNNHHRCIAFIFRIHGSLQGIAATGCLILFFFPVLFFARRFVKRFSGSIKRKNAKNIKNV